MEADWRGPPVPDTASLGIRLVAFTVDALVVTGVFIAGVTLVLVGTTLAQGPPGRAELAVLLIPVALAYLPVLLGYFTVSEAVWGRTLGKRIVNLRSVRQDGEPLSAFDAFIRNVLRFPWFILPLAPIFIPIDLYLMYAGELDQRIGDLGAETVVVRTA